MGRKILKFQRATLAILKIGELFFCLTTLSFHELHLRMILKVNVVYSKTRFSQEFIMKKAREGELCFSFPCKTS